MKYALTTVAGLALLVSAACGETSPSPSLGPVAPSGLDLANPSDAATRTYRVTIDNLTAGQPFSPGILVTHSNKVRVFETGTAASAEVRQIAEDGNPGPAETALSSHAEVFRASTSRPQPMPTSCRS
jgi:peptidoglycan hydrolase-like protein with peptidoglycan-binding domain